MLSGTRTCTAREPRSPATWSQQRWHISRKGGRARRRASTVLDTHLSSKEHHLSRRGWVRGEKRESFSLAPLFPSLSRSSLATTDTAGARTAARQTAAAVLCVSRPRSLTALFERGPRARREAVEKRGKTTR